MGAYTYWDTTYNSTSDIAHIIHEVFSLNITICPLANS